MSQILISRADRSNSLLFQDLYFPKKRTFVKSSVSEAVCTICSKGLEEGVSVSAKRIGKKARFFCQYHFPKDM